MGCTTKSRPALRKTVTKKSAAIWSRWTPHHSPRRRPPPKPVWPYMWGGAPPDTPTNSWHSAGTLGTVGPGRLPSNRRRRTPQPEGACMRTIAVVNQKGGCGKTITSINLSAFLAREQRRVLLVDMDPQGHATLGLLGNAVPPSKTMYDVFLQEPGGRATALRDVIRSIHDNLHVASADILLSAIPETLAGQIGRENILSEALAGVAGDYDYVVVDCPPAVGLLTFNALKACSEAIVPMDPSFFALHGIGKLLETFEVLVKDTGHQIVPRVLVTLYPGRSPFVKAVVDEIRHHLDGRHFDVVIRYSIKLAEAASHGVPIVDYCRHCAGFDDYQALAAEVLRQEADFPDAEPVAIRQNGSARNGSADQ